MAEECRHSRAVPARELPETTYVGESFPGRCLECGEAVLIERVEPGTADWTRGTDGTIDRTLNNEERLRAPGCGGVSMNDVTEKIAGFLILTVLALINLAMVWLAFRGISYLLSFVGL